jgi:hypothetical protein
LPQNNAVQITTELLGAFGDRDDLRQEYVLIEWDFGKTAVHFAAERGDPGVLQVLLNALDPDRCHHHRLSAMRSSWLNGWPTPLHLAVLNEVINPSMSRALVDVLMQYARKCGDARELVLWVGDSLSQHRRPDATRGPHFHFEETNLQRMQDLIAPLLAEP